MRIQLFVAFLAIFGPCLALGQSDSNDKQVIESFSAYVQQHFASYEHNRRERTTLLGGGWAKAYYLPDQTSAGIDVQSCFVGQPLHGNVRVQIGNALHRIS